MKRASLFISHSGLNSIHDSLYLGVPLLLVPQQAEQTLNALRVVELGAGLMLKKGQVNRADHPQPCSAPACRITLQNSGKPIGDTFRAAGGVMRAADEIDNLLKKL